MWGTHTHTHSETLIRDHESLCFGCEINAVICYVDGRDVFGIKFH